MRSTAVPLLRSAALAPRAAVVPAVLADVFDRAAMVGGACMMVISYSALMMPQLAQLRGNERRSTAHQVHLGHPSF